MEFCDKCGGIMMPQRSGSKSSLVCRNCGKKKTSSHRGDFKITTIQRKEKEKIVVVEKKAQLESLPKTDTRCPKCENTEAFWWMQQTRAADEPPTRFLRCTNSKCSHIWREYE